MNVKVFNLLSRTNETRYIKWHKNWMRVFVIINNVGIIINVDMNAKNRLTKEDVIKDFFGIQVIANVNVINLTMLENI